MRRPASSLAAKCTRLVFLATALAVPAAAPAAPAVPASLLAAAAPAPAKKAPAGAAAQVAAHVERLRATAAGLPGTDADWKGLAPTIDQILTMVSGEVEAGRLYTALERLADAHRYLGAAAYRIGHPDMTATAEGFEAGWRAADAVLKEGEAVYRAGSWKKAPAAIRGVGEMEWGQVRHLYSAAREYAIVSGPAAGTHYVGEAIAALEFARFCHGLQFAAAPGAFAARSLAPEIAALDARVVAAYQPPRSIDNHADFIRINGTLKVAEELDQAGLHHGALVAWLRAQRLFGILEGNWAGGGSRPIETLQAEAAAVADRLHAPGDRSFALLLQQQAESAIARSANPEAAALQLLAADVVLTRVVPAFEAARAARPAVAKAAKDQVRVTLVRWPYT